MFSAVLFDSSYAGLWAWQTQKRSVKG